MEKKPFWQSLTIRSLAATVVGLVLQALVDHGILGPEIYSVAAQILTYLGLGGVAIGRTRADKPLGLSSSKAKIAAASLVALLATGCASTYSGATVSADLRGSGPAGMSAVLGVDGKEVCRAQGAKAKVIADKAAAKRFCALFAECKWTVGR